LCRMHKLKLVLQVARRRLHAVPPREVFYKARCVPFISHVRDKQRRFILFCFQK
jgi:hypothetical protein